MLLVATAWPCGGSYGWGGQGLAGAGWHRLALANACQCDSQTVRGELCHHQFGRHRARSFTRSLGPHGASTARLRAVRLGWTRWRRVGGCQRVHTRPIHLLYRSATCYIAQKATILETADAVWRPTAAHLPPVCSRSPRDPPMSRSSRLRRLIRSDCRTQLLLARSDRQGRLTSPL
jgi:hypothetical protein